LDYLRSKGQIDLYAVGGNGGSLAQKYWEIIPFPKFDRTKQDEIAKLYHNVEVAYNADTFTLADFLVKDNKYNQQAGIYELDKTAKQLKDILNQSIDNIVNDKAVKIKFVN
jgi:type I restriction enzyme S subunit